MTIDKERIQEIEQLSSLIEEKKKELSMLGNHYWQATTIVPFPEKLISVIEMAIIDVRNEIACLKDELHKAIDKERANE